MNHKIFKKIPYFILLGLFYFPGIAYGEVSVGIGPEYFLWKEFDQAGQQVLDETGYRASLRLKWTEEQGRQVLFGYSGKLYLGTVAYHGETLFPPIQPVSTDTAYSGFQNEGKMILRYPVMNASYLEMVTTLGWDHWARSIRIQGSNGNQVEDYDIFYFKLGPAFTPMKKSGFELDGGIKFPFYTYENAHFNTLGYDQNPALHPGKSLSFYGNFGYRFNSYLKAMIYYDSFRFSESSMESVTQNGIPAGKFYQPQSSMDLIGIEGIYYFP